MPLELLTSRIRSDKSCRPRTHERCRVQRLLILIITLSSLVPKHVSSFSYWVNRDIRHPLKNISVFDGKHLRPSATKSICRPKNKIFVTSDNGGNGIGVASLFPRYPLTNVRSTPSTILSPYATNRITPFSSNGPSICSFIPAFISSGSFGSIVSFRHDSSFVLSILLAVSAFGIAMEQKTTFGKALSAPLVTMLLTLCLANVGVIPFSSPVYRFINQFLVPLAVPLFLFDSDLKRVVRDAGSLLLAFCVGAVSTVVATIGAFALVPLTPLGSANQGWKVACALAARHIGGAINFVAVADTLNIDGGVVSAAIAADNVVVALYFAFLFYLATSGESRDDLKATPNTDESIEMTSACASVEASLSEEIVLPNEKQQNPITTSSIAYSIATASCLVTIGNILTKAICPSLSPIVLTSLLTVIFATLIPQWFHRYRTTGTAIGILFLQLFFAASGAAGSLILVIRQAPSLIAFSALQLLIHFAVLMGLGRGVMNLNKNELYLASNANVGGPTTAAAMAQAKEWPRLVLPALLVGVLGYATATAISLSLAPILTRLALSGRTL